MGNSTLYFCRSPSIDPRVFCKFIPDCLRLPSFVAIFISVFDRLDAGTDCGTDAGTDCGNDAGTDTDNGADALATLNTRVLAVG